MTTEDEAKQTGLPYKADGKYFRRVVPSPLPIRMLHAEMQALKILTQAGCVVICAGGGGIPIVQDPVTGKITGVEAVIDKDRAATMVAKDLGAQGLIILTDVTGVAVDFGTPQQRWIRAVTPGALQQLSHQFPEGSMGPKCASAIDFVQQTGGWAVIGSLQEAEGILQGTHGTYIGNFGDVNNSGEEDMQFHRDIDEMPKVAT